MIPELRPFQADLVMRIAATAARRKRIVVVQAATGAGKTSVAAFIARRASQKGSKTLFMAHRRKLVDQIHERLLEFQVANGVIMRDKESNRGALVQVASRDTLLSRCVNREWSRLPDADLIIVDEAHHAADPESEYRRILEAYPRAVILLLTATPVGPDGKGMGPWAQAIECAAPTSELIRDGYLTPLRCYAPDRSRKRGKVRKTGVAGDLVASWQQYAEGKPTILFCSRVKHSLDAVEAFKAEGISFAHVDADTDDFTRDRHFDEVACGKIHGISNVGIVGEGVDVPELGCCQLYHQCGSHVALLQRTGRIMRPFPGKTHGILIDHAGAIFRHGFPDEDFEWTLEGNADEIYQAKHDAGQTPKVLYCRHCEILFHDALACPQCGKIPSKPPRSIFDPPPQEHTDELLTEADRSNRDTAFSQEEKIAHWKRCLGMVANRNNGSFAQASLIYKRRYNEWPGNDFPYMPGWGRNKERIADIYPNFVRSKQA